ncbi:MAG: 3-isopropylmalate dehydratase small subunit [bacterium]|nr:3-isopropylmalate dehydratase small subunit [bacterium]
MIQKIQGRVWKLGDQVDTDVIYPGRYLPILDPAEMARHALEGVDPGFPEKLQPGDILVAGSNFGCGSSREQAATCLKAAGVTCVVAKSFARIFFRNAINLGLPLVESADAPDRLQSGDILSVDFEAGLLRTGEARFRFPALPPMVMEILDAGGLIAQVRARLGREGTPEKSGAA